MSKKSAFENMGTDFCSLDILQLQEPEFGGDKGFEIR